MPALFASRLEELRDQRLPVDNRDNPKSSHAEPRYPPPSSSCLYLLPRLLTITDTPYNYETGVDLREQMTMCDVGDVFTIPANIEKTFDQISNAVAYVSASGAMPIIMGGDHSIGYPTVRG